MQEDIRKKVFLDVFVSKATLLPVVAGGTVGLLSIAVDAPMFALGGFAAVIAGVGICATKLIFGLEKVTESAFTYLKEQKKAQLDESLNILEEQLMAISRTSAGELTLLRAAYNRHKEQVEKGEVTNSDALEEKLEKLFHGCIEQLKYSIELHNTAQTLSKSKKEAVLEKRKKVLTEVKDSVECFHQIIDEIAGINTDKSTKSLSNLRDDVKSSFEIVKRTEARLDELDGPKMSEAEMEEYRKFATENNKEK
jgi:hypothetical protein